MELNFKLTQFEGPLDLLLHLIEKSKIDIEDIFVSDITEQYLCYMGDMSELDMDLASDFLNMASTLLEIKSRSLLPKPPPLEEGEEDPQQALIRRLKEYKLYKELGEELRQKAETLEGMYYKLPQEMHYEERFEFENVSLDALLNALSDVIMRLEKKHIPPAVREIRRDVFSVKDKIQHIRRRLIKTGTVAFSRLFDEDTSKEEVVVTFLAVLELIKAQFITVQQSGIFSEIIVSRIPREEN